MFFYNKPKNIKSFLPKIEAELFVSLGGACRPAHWLRKFNLRKASYPFDWMCSYSLDFYAETIQKGCYDWFNSCREEFCHSQETRRIVDNKSNLVSLHAFPCNETVEEFLPKFHKIFDEKYLKFKQALSENENICFVSNRPESTREFVSFAKKLKLLYPTKTITIVNLKHHLTKRKTTKLKISNKISLYTIYADDRNEEGADFQTNPRKFWIGNTQLWTNICAQLTLKEKKAIIPGKFFSVTHKKNRRIIRLLGLKITI